MIVLSHRGFWLEANEKNTRIAFERSFHMDFGTETDLRDRGSKLVISHDMPDAKAMPVNEFFEIYCNFNKSLPLAFNIKADGLQQELSRLLRLYEIRNYFVFDMAVPDALSYVQGGLMTFTRHSEYEVQPAYYKQAQGVWLDEFTGHWISDSIIEHHLANGKSLCIVSPELHKRGYLVEWAHYRDLENKLGIADIMLCTDYPKQAQEFFNE